MSLPPKTPPPPPSTPPPQASAALLVGRTLCQFRILAKLGEGGMGVVYKALDTELRRPVAIKVLTGVGASPLRRRRLLREARSSAAVSHPNIATVYEVYESEGVSFIALELVEGRTLRELIALGPVDPYEACAIARGVARALSKAHSVGLVHRDLTPDNVMVTADGHVKVLDFGLAKLKDIADEEDDGDGPVSTTLTSVMTQEGRIIGTPAYMSPEQVAGEPSDPRTDVFSLGVVLFELLTARRPFQGDTAMALAVAISRDTAPMPSEIVPTTPAALDALVARCLSKSPSARFQNCDALLDALDAIDGGFPVPGRRASMPDATGRDRASSEPRFSARTANAGSAAGRGEPAPSAAWRVPAVIALVSLLAGVIVVASPARKAAPRPPLATAPAGPRPTAVTELELPTSPSPEAIAAYRAGLQALRDAAWDVARANFRRAAQIDPNMAAAHLRLAVTSEGQAAATDVREEFQRAMQLRHQLGDRDRLLLEAMEPLLQRDVPDREAHVARLADAISRYPGDAELLLLHGTSLGRTAEETLAASIKVLELDPKYADAWQTKARALMRLARPKEALVALDKCLASSPASNDCLYERMMARAVLGECAKIEPDARRLIAKDPQSAAAYSELARSLAAIGRSRETIEEALEQKWARVPAADRPRERLLDKARLAMLLGDFVGAEADAMEAQKVVAGDPNEDAHARPAQLLVRIYQETGRDQLAADVAEAFLRRREAWVPSTGLSPLSDPTPVFLHAERRGGRITREREIAQRDAWIDLWRARAPRPAHGEIWFGGLVQTAETAADARAVLDAKAAFDPHEDLMLDPSVSAAVGQVYVLAGRDTDALPLLQRGASSCDALTAPIATLQGYTHLAQVLESVGDRVGACNAYANVLARWGSAKPRSVTADVARKHARALGCAETSGAVARAPGMVGVGAMSDLGDGGVLLPEPPMNDDDGDDGAGDEAPTGHPMPAPHAAATARTPFLSPPAPPEAPAAPILVNPSLPSNRSTQSKPPATPHR